MTTTIAARIEALRDQLHAAGREAWAIAEAVDMLDADTLTDTTEASLREVIDSLADLHRALIGTDELVESAIHHARRLP